MPSYKDQLYGAYYDDVYLQHHGVMGQKWGVRRFQKEDGTRTPLGKKHEQILQGYKDTADWARSEAKSDLKKLRPLSAANMLRGARRVERNGKKLEKQYKSEANMKPLDTDSGATKRAKRDWATMNDKDFRAKYQTSKKAYEKRVNNSESGDPFKDNKNRVMATGSDRKKARFEKAIDDEAKQMTSHHLSEKAKAYRDSESLGKRTLKRMVLGKAGTENYNMSRAAGYSKGRSLVNTLLSQTIFSQNYAKNAADNRYQNSAEGRRYTENIRRGYED